MLENRDISTKEQRQFWPSLWSAMRHHWLTIAFVGGFVTDFILLNRIDDSIDNTILSIYALLATVSLVLFYAGIAKRFGDRLSSYIERYANGVMQYAFGGLFSGMLIFYGRSGSLMSSWPFLLCILSAILGNELIKNRGQRLAFNLYAYFVGIFSFTVLQVPIITGMMGGWIFFASSILALIAVYIVIQILTYIIPNYLLLEMRKIVFVILGTFAILQVLYVTNIMPPIPLSLKEITIAQSVVKVGSDYEITYEPAPWWQFWKGFHEEFHPATGSVACFTRVFAPTKLTTKIFHVWEYKDPNSGAWVHHFSLPFSIVGGGDAGYRGYTAISSFRDGVWRCRVETERGQVIGQQVFTIDSTVKPAALEKVVE
jgi:Protein of unknown function (DUF2914)